MSEGTSSPPPESAGRRLSGWKDIAAYFDRSVRTVQRWEAEHGLPIRRLGIGRAEVVTALVADLERWREGAEAQAARQAADAVELGNGGTSSVQAPELAAETAGTVAARVEQAPASPGAIHGPRILRRGWWPALGGLLLVLVIIAGVWWKWAGASADEPGEPSSVEAVGRSLRVYDARGGLLWTHEFADPLTAARRLYAVEDLNADGHQEVLAIAGQAGAAPSRVRLHCFNYRGDLLWTRQQAGPQTFGSEVYAPPFVPQSFLVSDAPDGKKYVWVISSQIPWFPSVLYKLDSTGSVRGEYWSNGHITQIELVQWDGRRAVLVGARNNEHGSASLALLDEDQPSGAAPATDPRYQCRTCPAGAPLAFVVFPKPKRLGQLSGTAPVESIQTDVNGSAVAWVNYGADFAVTTLAFYSLDHELRPASIGTADTFETACLELARKGSIPPFVPGSGLERLRSLLWWDGTAFRELHAQRGPERPLK